jgi:hypothetical protein
MTTALRSCTSCGGLTFDRCGNGHALCARCKDEVNMCEACLEAEADKVRGLA